MNLIADIKSAFYKLRALVLKNQPPKVAVISLHGVIGSGGRGKSAGIQLQGMEEYITKAFALNGVKAVALSINSPGGSPVQSALIYNKIRREAAKHNLPVYTFAEDVCASGGYWLACAGEEIYAMESSIVGSIGVVAGGFGFHELIQRHGIERRIYTAGKSKAMLDPFKPEKPEDVEHLKSLQADVHESFKALVRDARGERISKDEDTLFSGSFWSGKKALELGLIDGLGDAETILREKFGDKVKLVPFIPNRSWLKDKLGMTFARDLAESVIDAAESRAHWGRFGF